MVLDLSLKHCHGDKKQLAQLLGKKVQVVYRWVSGAGGKVLVPDVTSISLMSEIILNSGSQVEKEHLLIIFKSLIERLCRVALDYEKWLDRFNTLPISELKPEIKVYAARHVASTKGVLEKPIEWEERVVCANCGLGAMFPKKRLVNDAEVPLCEDCAEKFDRGGDLKVLRRRRR